MDATPAQIADIAPTTVADRLRERRSRAGLSQNALEVAAHLPKSTVRKIEIGSTRNPGDDVLAKIAGALNCTVAELRGEAAAARDPRVGPGDDDEASAPAPAPEPAPEIRLIPHGRIAPDPENPRTAFASLAPDAPAADALALDADLAGLADAIFARGLLQPITVRPVLLDSDAEWRIVMGERRWRAIALLVADGRRPADWPVPCLVDEDGDWLVDAIVENLQRKDPPPLDEAHAYRRLIGELGWTKDAVAGTVGKSVRHVELRLALVEKLSPPVQAMLAEGKITLAAARILTSAPPADQEAHAKAVAANEWGYRTAEQIRAKIAEGKPPLKAAAFKRETYDARGGAYVGSEEDGNLAFADLELFKELQFAAAAARVERLQKRNEYKFVAFHNAHESSWPHDRWARCWSDDKLDRKTIGAVVAIDRDWTVETVRVREVKAPKAAAPKPDFTKAHIARANRIKTGYVAAHLATEPVEAMRLAIMGLAGFDQVKISAERPRGEDVSPDRRDDIEILAQFMPEDLAARVREDEYGYRHDDELAVAVWRWLSGLDYVGIPPAVGVSDILAEQVSRQFGTWNEFQPELGDTPLFRAVADRVLDPAQTVWPDWQDETWRDDYLASLGKDRLIEIVRAAGCAPRANELAGMKGIHTLTGKKPREIVIELADEGALAGFIPRELRIGSAEELAAPLPPAGGDEEA